MEVKLMNNSKITPKVIFNENAYYDMLSFFTAKVTNSKEFMFIGTVEKLKDNIYWITSTQLIPQEANSGAFCETDDDRYPGWLHDHFPTVELKNKVRLNGHSHVNMAVEPSGTDNQNIEKMMQYVDDFFIQLIINKRQEIKINLWDKETGLIFNTCPYYVQIGEAIVKFENSNTSIPKLIKLPELKLEDFKPTPEKNTFSNGTVTINLINNITTISTDKLYYTPGQKLIALTTEPEIKQIEEQFKVLLKTPKYNNLTYNNDLDYDDNPYTHIFNKGGKRKWK